MGHQVLKDTDRAIGHMDEGIVNEEQQHLSGKRDLEHQIRLTKCDLQHCSGTLLARWLVFAALAIFGNICGPARCVLK